MRKFLQAFIALALAFAATPGIAHEAKVGEMLITNLWSRATPGGAQVAGGYLTIENKGTAADRLVSAVSSGAARVEIHEMATANGVMTMRPLEKGLVIAPGQTVTLAPGGLHLMFMDIKQPLKQGDKLGVTLQFEKAGQVETFLHVQGVGAQSSEAGHSGMKM